MKVRKLIRKFHEAIFAKDKEAEEKFWRKILKKSLEHKKTYLVR